MHYVCSKCGAMWVNRYEQYFMLEHTANPAYRNMIAPINPDFAICILCGSKLVEGYHPLGATGCTGPTGCTGATGPIGPSGPTGYGDGATDMPCKKADSTTESHKTESEPKYATDEWFDDIVKNAEDDVNHKIRNAIIKLVLIAVASGIGAVVLAAQLIGEPEEEVTKPQEESPWVEDSEAWE